MAVHIRLFPHSSTNLYRSGVNLHGTDTGRAVTPGQVRVTRGEQRRPKTRRAQGGRRHVRLSWQVHRDFEANALSRRVGTHPAPRRDPAARTAGIKKSGKSDACVCAAAGHRPTPTDSGVAAAPRAAMCLPRAADDVATSRRPRILRPCLVPKNFEKWTL